MTEEIPSDIAQHLEAMLAESMRWAQLQLTYEEILTETKPIVRDMQLYSLKSALPILSGLLTVPAYQSNCIRLELLVALAVLSCSGKKKASIAQAVRWYRQIGQTKCVRGEDPAEDVFVTNVNNNTSNYLLLEGVWENAGFYTQRIIDLVATFPNTPRFDQLRRSLCATLKIVDEVCKRSGLQRYSLGNDERQATLKAANLPNKSELAKRVTFSSADLEHLGINPLDIVPIWSPTVDREAMLKQAPGYSIFEHQVLVQVGPDNFVAAMPSALSVCARNLVIGFIAGEGLQDEFDYMLGQIYAELIHETPLLGGRVRAPVHWGKIDGTRFASFSMEIDTGHILSYFLYLPSITRHAHNGFKSIIIDDGTIWKHLDKLIKRTITDAEARAEFKRGQIILVGCGWGKGLAMKELTAESPAWHVENISVADLIRLSWLEGMSPEYFIRVQDGLRAVEEIGVEIFNVNGVLNLIAWARKNNGHIIPHHAFLNVEVEEGLPNLLNFPQDLLRGLRAEADQVRDLHRIQDYAGQWRLCQSASMGALFENHTRTNLFNCLDSIKTGELLTVLEGDFLIWVTVTADEFPSNETAFRLWEMVREWLPRIADELKNTIKTLLSAPPLLLEMRFEGSGQFEMKQAMPDRTALLEMMSLDPSIDGTNRTLVRFGDGFMNGFRYAKNIAERVVVEGMLRAIMQHLGLQIPDHGPHTFIDNIVKNDDARSFHAIHGHDFLQYVWGSLPRKLVKLNEADDAIVKLGLAQKAVAKKARHRIAGVEECCSFLEAVVDGLLKELRADLSRFKREEALKRVYLNIEKSHAEEDHWRRTSAAIIGLHGERPEALKVYVEQSSKFSAASVTGRILLEIGLCECPSEGEALSNMELSRMMAKASIVYRLGGLSDALKYRALTAELHVSPFGDILVEDDFGKFVVQPVLSRMIGQRFRNIAPKQRQNYEEAPVLLTTEDRFEPEFWAAWKGEFGFTIDDGRQFLTLTEDEGVRRESAVYETRRSELIRVLSVENANEEAVVGFIDTFSLKPRTNWAKPPKGFSIRDIYPWAFSRRLSVVARPILQLDNTLDPLLIVAPHSLRGGFRYLITGAHRAELPQDFFQTDALRNKWWGKAGEGHTHAKEIAERLNKAGWQTCLEITLPRILNKKFPPDHGDIDVLAWKKDYGEVWVIEAKDLSRARNHSEMAHMLSDYQGQTKKNGEPDKLLKHLQRVDLLKGDPDGVAKFCKIHKPAVKSALICSGIVPMQYAKIDALEGTFVGSIEDLIESLKLHSGHL